MTIRKMIQLASFVSFFSFIAFSIAKKESIRANSPIILFALEPEDPRSMFQGDYMTLRYTLVEKDMDSEAFQNLPNADGILYFQILDGVASSPISFSKPVNSQNPSKTWGCIRYFRHSSQLRFGAEQYFFQEDHAKIFEKAKFAGIAISPDCEPVLVGLYDINKTLLLGE